MKKRRITKRQEQAYRLVSGEFEGLSVREAAKKMGISRTAVYNLLDRLNEEVPELFPILDWREALTLEMLQRGVKNFTIAEVLGINCSGVTTIIASLVEKKRWSKRKTFVFSFNTDMEKFVVKKF
jgi:predicted transcriptional regulator